MNAAALLTLQETDTALDVAANQRPRVPEVAAHAAAQQSLAALQAQQAAAQQRIDAAQAAIEAAEHSTAELTKKRTRLEAQLKTVIAPREAEALMHEIELINAQRGELDDQELVALEEQGEAEGVLAALTAESPAKEAELAAAKAALDDVHAALDAHVAELHEQRIAAAAALPASEVAVYERVRKQFGGVGVAKLEGSHCSGCHMDLSPRELDLVKAVPLDETAECPQCGRIIVR